MNQNNTDNEPGPSTSHAGRSAPQASTSVNVVPRNQGSQLSRIPRISRRVDSPQVSPMATTRIRSRNLQLNQNEPAPHLRQQNMTIRGDVSSRVNAPISSRTRSQHNSNLLEPHNQQNSRELRGGQRNGMSRIRLIPPRPLRSALTHSDNNHDQPQHSRRRRIALYSPPPPPVRRIQSSFMNLQELLRNRIDGDSDSSSSQDSFPSPPLSISDPGIIQLSPQSEALIPRNISNDREMAAEPLRVDISDDSD
jgi:hypothetical protein